MDGPFSVRAAAGSMRANLRADAVLPHRWSQDGVAIELEFTGAHLFHLAAAGCVLNDLYREASHLGIELTGVLVCADGVFDTDSWQSTGVSYEVHIDSPAQTEVVDRLIAVVDEIAEIPKALRAGTSVSRCK